MKRLILTAIVGLFSTLTVWAQTGTTAPQSIASAGATPTRRQTLIAGSDLALGWDAGLVAVASRVAQPRSFFPIDQTSWNVL